MRMGRSGRSYRIGRSHGPAVRAVRAGPEVRAVQVTRLASVIALVRGFPAVRPAPQVRAALGAGVVREALAECETRLTPVA